MCRISPLPESGAWQPKIQLRDAGTADLLVQERVVEKALAGAAGLRRQVRRPEALCFRLGAQLLDQCVALLVLEVEAVLVREDVLVHERAIGSARLGELLGAGDFGRGHAASIADHARPGLRNFPASELIST